ncbi:mechanosensitive ion channel family protein [Ferrimonas sp. SCSIO 43195]|uniref:mechanosensitive ion channel family protein n=1 Tax=Ferrimonas sp. SCSIO 43195 TaxID=2822844 RepID=UPI002074DB46|nr:mechanosensitive ion channel domain-containing protein [Ferrimonas sp. SCSIO 43195]USD37571.1 mechanosensitive ion channel [Ferrimonas sp. SCSIO 43195]
MEQEIKNEMRHWLAEWMTKMDIPTKGDDLLTVGIIATVALITAFVVYSLFIRILVHGTRRVIERSNTTWALPVKQHRVLEKLAQIAPLVVLDLFTPMMLNLWPFWEDMASRLLELTMLVMSIRVLYACLDTVRMVASTRPEGRRLPVQSIVQLTKLFLFIVALILFIGIMLDKSPLYLLSGLGVATGLVMLVFRDTILGFVAGIQLAANRMVSPGDWIEMSKYGADGEVVEVTLTTVKVQNWDKTITMIPAYALTTDAFRNWRGMQESGGRRIKRAVNLDVNSIRFVDESLLAQLQRIELLQPYLEQKLAELKQANLGHKDMDMTVNGRRMTNLGCLRAYLDAYLNAHPQLTPEMTMMVRQLAPSELGLPLELYCFTNDTRWAVYEGIQADIFDHLFAILPEFELRPMQRPSGLDFAALTPAHAE